MSGSMKNVQKIQGYNTDTITRHKPADPLVLSPKRQQEAIEEGA